MTWQKRYQLFYNINFAMRVTIITTNGSHARHGNNAPSLANILKESHISLKCLQFQRKPYRRSIKARSVETT